jgi:hypothetical protein
MDGCLREEQKLTVSVMYGYIKKALGARPGLEIHKDEPAK